MHDSEKSTPQSTANREVKMQEQSENWRGADYVKQLKSDKE